jgi:hypothetical protein
VLVFADLLQALGELRNLIGCPVLGLVHGANADPLRRKRRGELSGEGGDAMLRGPQLTDERLHLLGIHPDETLIVAVVHIAS